ncbi:hypothetical protein AGMMS50284_5660 [Clostridia bacterium]|nr:hypothetical protein AGMMS50284_5660 [Clostridia bacterium]
MSKKIISIVMAVALMATIFCFATVSTSAYSGTITFDVPTEQWATANKRVYAHIWAAKTTTNEGASLYGWQTVEEQMTYSEDQKTATYEVPEGDWNLIIISGNSGWQTYDTVMNANCIGDVIYADATSVQNPVDSNKTCYLAHWRTNSDLGPHKGISSLGVVTDGSYCDGETAEDMYNTFYEGYKDDAEVHPWKDDAAITTGKSFDQICKEIRAELGLPEPATDAPAAGDTSSSSSAAGSSSAASNASSSKPTNTTATGDTTNYVILGVILAAALGVVVVALVARKKTKHN